MKFSNALAATLLLAAITVPATSPAADDSSVPEALRLQLPTLMERYRVPTVAVAGIRDGRLAWTWVVGERASGVAADPETVFNVASLTKPLFALLTLRLVAEGALDLDESVAKYWVDPDVAHDPRHLQLTPRLLLSHQGGFGNWRGDGKLAFAFDPGSRHEYSGEGFEYLRRSIERKTGRTLPELMRVHVLEEAGFEASFGWSDDLVDRIAMGFNESGAPVDMHLAQRSPNAAANTMTSVVDYGRFIAWVVSGAGLPKAQFDAMLRPQAAHDDPAERFGLGWKLAVGDAGTTLWHDGRENGVRTLAIARPHARDGLVVLINSSNGELLTRAIVSASLPQGDAWLSQVDADVWHYLNTAPGGQLAMIMQTISRSPSYMSTLIHAANSSLMQSETFDAALRSQAEQAIEPWVTAMLAGRVPRQRIEALVMTLIDPASPEAGPQLLQSFDRVQAAAWLESLRTDDLPSASGPDVADTNDRPTVDVPGSVLAQYAGAYLVPSSNLQITIVVAGSNLIASAPGVPTTIFYPASERRFFMKESGTDFEFERGSDGSVSGMRIVWDGSRSEFARRVQ